MSAFTSTRENLLSIVDDMELICRELLENLMAPKPKRLSAEDHEELTQLLMEKNTAFKKSLELASEQGKIEEEIRQVEAEVQCQDESIKQLQKQFKEAETLLSTSIYQARQKLKSIEKATSMPVASEELIKFSHRISASNAVCAPLNWQQGDARRPYPTDLEMRLSFLSRPADAAAAVTPVGGDRSSMIPHMRSAGMTPQHEGGGNFHGMTSPFAGTHSSPSKMQQQQQQHSAGATSGGQFMWQGGEMGMTMKDGSHVPIEARGAQEDVEVMSTDSSSSSSTDSN